MVGPWPLPLLTGHTHRPAGLLHPQLLAGVLQPKFGTGSEFPRSLLLPGQGEVCGGVEPTGSAGVGAGHPAAALVGARRAQIIFLLGSAVSPASWHRCITAGGAGAVMDVVWVIPGLEGKVVLKMMTRAFGLLLLSMFTGTQIWQSHCVRTETSEDSRACISCANVCWMTPSATSSPGPNFTYSSKKGFMFSKLFI